VEMAALLLADEVSIAAQAYVHVYICMYVSVLAAGVVKYGDAGATKLVAPACP
jgi:hypothetical protein